VFVLVAFKYNSSNSEINTLYCFYNDKIEKLFTDLQEIIGRDYDKDSAIKRAFGKVIYSEFRGVAEFLSFASKSLIWKAILALPNERKRLFLSCAAKSDFEF
jgi:hypothetical protein